MITLTLYTTLGCHLCDQVKALLVRLSGEPVRLDEVEISDEEALMVRYGERIPVLADAAGDELDQPMDPERLADWLKARDLLSAEGLDALKSPPDHAPVRAFTRNGRRYLRADGHPQRG